MSHLYIFDYSNCTINHIDVGDTVSNEEETEEVLKKHGFKESECSYMISDEELKINHIDNDNEDDIYKKIYTTDDETLYYLKVNTKFKLKPLDHRDNKNKILKLKIINSHVNCKDCPLVSYNCGNIDCNVELVK